METPCFIAEAAKLVLMRSESRVPKKKETSPSTLNFDEVKSGEISAQPHNSLCLQYWMREGSGVTIALQTLEVLLPGKINYDEPPDDAGDPDSHDPDSEKFSLQGMYSH